MQKLLSGLLVFSVVLLSGCWQQQSLDEATIVQTAIQKSFLYSEVFSFLDTNPFYSTGIIRESLGLYSNSSSETLSSNIEIAITTDNANTNTFSSIVFSGWLQDKIHNDVFNGSGTLYYISTGDQRYINIQEWYVDLWTGNTESFVIGMILDAIRSQWMLIDDNELIHTDILTPIDGSKVLDLLTWIRTLVRQEWLLIPRVSSISWLYPLTVSDSGSLNTQIQSLYTTLGKESSTVDVSFMGSIQTLPEPALVIQSLEDLYNNWQLSGYIWVRNGALTLNQENTIRTISWEEKKSSITLQLSIQNQDNDPISLDLVIEPKSIANAVWWLAYEWEISFALSANNILTFPIAGLYGIYIVNQTQFVEPVRYILMSQLFGDEYGIARILESE
jgi:hypothetical protein